MNHAANRDIILGQLRRELVGPDPAGAFLDATKPLAFTSWDEYRKPHYQEADGEEILIDQTPTQRYGVGVLFPQNEVKDLESAVVEGASGLVGREQVTADDIAMGAGIQGNAGPSSKASEDDASGDLDLSTANAFSPSSMAISFLADLGDVESIQINASGGRYIKKTATIREDSKQGVDRDIWLRQSVTLTVEVATVTLLGSGTKLVTASPRRGAQGVKVHSTNSDGLDLSVEVFSRPHARRDMPNQRLLTICLVNRTPGHGSNKNSASLFQSHFDVTIVGADGSGAILPYPTPVPVGDEEQLGLDMLYRNIPVFATGHGCAANWPEGTSARVSPWVSAECLPTVTLAPITPTILDDDGNPLTVSMAGLCNLEPGNDIWCALENLVARYEKWIEAKEQETASVGFDPRYLDAASHNLSECKRAAARMWRGLAFLRQQPLALRAFRLANEAMMRQQVASRFAQRPVKYDPVEGRVVVEGPIELPDALPVDQGIGSWRPFQIGFLLASIESTGNLESSDHELVDLIWFPTGGGKTEAYLGLAAYVMFLRRLRDPDDAGVTVLMRYTLRLLTTQQFERASSLICAMDRIRDADPGSLGVKSFSIGIWLGGETTPNRREEAVVQLREYSKDRYADNPFLINQCPWCGASLGRVDIAGKQKGKKQGGLAAGYRQDVGPDGKPTVVIHCPDRMCAFADRLPILVIDEDVYALPPSMVIGTIDKFARLTWDDRPRQLFGIDGSGDRIASPPQLIIQDELHLISGPLGSLSGLLEPVVEDLCTDHRENIPVRPKIVCSTATTRRYRDQILGLYGRQDVCLFPPPGLDSDDSFFARTDSNAEGKTYVGIHAPGFGSYQTEWVRALTALVNAPMELDGPEARDPWWTLLIFCNSLRDMGTAHTLLNTDVLDYSISYWQRHGTTKTRKRYISNANSVLELTGGLKRAQIKEALDALETGVGAEGKTVDVCLATNIIEVGVDIPRLSLMAVAGQPKTTAQYIQATGRVGRSAGKPGLVAMLYGPSKPRDRSHFERFRAYHERLYAQVEPTSVTPFSPPALKRLLHSALIAHVRQNEPRDDVQSPYPLPEGPLQHAVDVLRERLEVVDASELANFESEVTDRLRKWTYWERKYWDRAPEGEVPLLRHAGTYATASAKTVSWSTMDSLRNVDAECYGEITHNYLNHLVTQGEDVANE